MHGKRLPRELSLLLGRSFDRKVLSNVILRSLRQFPVEPIVDDIVSLAMIRVLEVDKLVEEHNKELTTDELIELHCVSQQEVMEEEVTAKQQSSSAIREILKAWGNCCILTRETSP
ncbi:hypothetical protein AVEN_246318-1 [Araneus ventricosus]|uniref:Uncharacterized protein n=1 Tax=Araneus ventricosus TaxID=182803 RepID=A0A4Y2W4E6_ARAVE|nr:hypothetical protein AVEN_246318-1 [Araneus ventricosus]